MEGGMHSRGRAWQERRLLQRAVRILLECILVNLILSLFNKSAHVPGILLFPAS